MLAEILPPTVAIAEAFGDRPHAALFPDEEPIVARAVPSRRRAFSTGRDCARQALAQLGVERSGIPADRQGAPRWPAGIVGSITHCEKYRAAAVGRVVDVVGIGIDAEPNVALPVRTVGRIASASEQNSLFSLKRTEPSIAWDRLLFSAKEAIYKAWYSFTGSGVEFADIAVAFDPVHGSFSTHLTDGERLCGLSGRWLVRDGLALTSVALLATGRLSDLLSRECLLPGGRPAKKPSGEDETDNPPDQ